MGSNLSTIGRIVQTLKSATDKLTSSSIIDDGSDTATWPNRWEWLFKPVAGTSRRVMYINEYGELRGVSAKSNTVAARWFAKEYAADADHDAATPVIEVMNNRDARVSLFAVMPDGTITGKNLGQKVVVVPNTLTTPQRTAVITAQPDGTVIFTYDPAGSAS